MNKKSIMLLLCLIISAVIVHLVTLNRIPGFIMGKALTKLEVTGASVSTFSLAPRVTPQTQRVVRPSPDLAYSICLFDFKRDSRPIDVSAAPWRDYSSVSFFDANTNNFHTLSLPADAKRTSFVLAYGGTAPNGADVITAPTHQGVILIRRLAPTHNDYNDVVKIAADDRCAPADSAFNTGPTPSPMRGRRQALQRRAAPRV